MATINWKYATAILAIGAGARDRGLLREPEERAGQGRSPGRRPDCRHIEGRGRYGRRSSGRHGLRLSPQHRSQRQARCRRRARTRQLDHVDLRQRPVLGLHGQPHVRRFRSPEDPLYPFGDRLLHRGLQRPPRQQVRRQRVCRHGRGPVQGRRQDLGAHPRPSLEVLRPGERAVHGQADGARRVRPLARQARAGVGGMSEGSLRGRDEVPRRPHQGPRQHRAGRLLLRQAVGHRRAAAVSQPGLQRRGEAEMGRQPVLHRPQILQ